MVAKSFSLAGSGSEAVDGLAGQGTLDGLIHPQCGEVFGDFLQVHLPWLTPSGEEVVIQVDHEVRNWRPAWPIW